MDKSDKEKKQRDPGLLIQQIKEGVLDPEKDEITTEERQECVHALKLEGSSNAAIARLFKCSVKTIQRDLTATWKADANDIAKETALYRVAEFLAKARANHENLVRLANSQEGEHEHRVNAARFAGEALRKMVEMLQSLGQMPKEATKIQEEIHHHREPEKTAEQLKKELADFEKNVAELGINDPTIQSKLNALRKRIELTEVDKELKNLKDQYLNPDKSKDNDGSDE